VCRCVDHAARLPIQHLITHFSADLNDDDYEDDIAVVLAFTSSVILNTARDRKL